MQTVSLPWLAYSITGSPILLGIIGALQYLPVLLFSLYVGAIIDRFEKKNVVMFAQVSLAGIALVLAALVLAHQVRYWHLLVLALAIGMINAVDFPSRQAFNIEMVGKNDLTSAIGLNSAVYNGARIVGPAIAGILMEGIGIGYCFLINAITFIPLIIALFFIQPVFPYRSKSGNNKISIDILDGLKYMLSDTVIVNTIIGVFIVGTFIMNFSILLPVLAKTGLKLGEKGYGFLWSSMGIGSLAGALFVAARSRRGQNIVLSWAAFIVSVLFIALGLNDTMYMASIILSLIGFLAVAYLVTANSTLQLQSLDEYRSRVISLFMLVNAGVTPIGNLFAGTLTDIFGIKACFVITGVAVFAMLTVQYYINAKNAKPGDHRN